MTKEELIEAIAKGADISKSKAKMSLNTMLDSIKKVVSKGGKVQLIGFGSFSSGKRAARIGRNPKTGGEIKIPASKTVKFSAGKTFKEAVNARKK